MNSSDIYNCTLQFVLRHNSCSVFPQISQFNRQCPNWFLRVFGVFGISLCSPERRRSLICQTTCSVVELLVFSKVKMFLKLSFCSEFCYFVFDAPVHVALRNLRGEFCCRFRRYFFCMWCTFLLIPLYISKRMTTSGQSVLQGLKISFFYHWKNWVIESTVCLMDVGCVTHVLPAAVWMSMSVLLLWWFLALLLLATSFSENSTRSTCLI